MSHQLANVEKIVDYCSLQQESAKHSDKPPPPDWPSLGAITFSKTSLKYSDKAPLVLKDIDCHIKGKEKVFLDCSVIFIVAYYLRS